MKVRKRRGAVAVLMLMAVTLALAVPVLAVQIGNHDVTFDMVQYDYPAPGQSTWYYAVTNLAYGPGHNISHLVMESCLPVATDPVTGQLLAGTWDGSDPTSLVYGGGMPVYGFDPTTGVVGIKFDQGFTMAGEVLYYFFVIDLNAAPAPMGVTIKAGQDIFSGTVTGPACVPTAVTVGGLSAEAAQSPAAALGLPAFALAIAGGLAAGLAVARRRLS